MKRSMAGGAHRGPVGPTRQRRTIRFIQLLLVATALALVAFAGYSYGRVHGYDAGKRVGDLDPPKPPSVGQSAALLALGAIALVGAALLQDGGGVRIPTPAKLDDLASRAERTAIEKAEEIAGSSGDAASKARGSST